MARFDVVMMTEHGLMKGINDFSNYNFHIIN